MAILQHQHEMGVKIACSDDARIAKRPYSWQNRGQILKIGLFKCLRQKYHNLNHSRK